MDINVSIRNYNNCCRTCLSESSREMYDIFDNINDSVNVNKILSTYASMQVSIEDQLPKKLCSNCYNCLLSFHNFVNVALRVDTQLREYFLSFKPILVKKEQHNTVETEDNASEYESDTTIKEEISIEENIEYDPTENNTSNHSDETEHVTDIPITEKVILKCETCNKIFKQQTNYDNHVLKHTQEKCELSDQCFTNHVAYKQHLDTHKEDTNLISDIQQNTNKKFVCDVCSVAFKSIPSLSAHKKVHIVKGRVLQCVFCDKIFTKISHLKRHELCHTKNYRFKCTLCPKVCRTEESLAAHIDHHNGVKNHRCPICMRMFCYLRNLTSHIKMHTTMKPYLCPTCGKMFESSTNLNQHMKRHEGDKCFACNLCPKKFVSKGELKAHSRTHTQERPFTCDLCSRAYPKRSSLEKHKLTHLGVKPHQCDVCVKKFAHKNHLKRHYRTHTGEKPYRCENCERAFTQSNDLVKHRRTHLGNNLYKCSECTQSFRLKTELRQHISEHFISAQRVKLAEPQQTQTLQENVTLETVQSNVNGTVKYAQDAISSQI